MASFQKRGKTWQYTISRMVNGKSDPIRDGGFTTKREAQLAAAPIELALREEQKRAKLGLKGIIVSPEPESVKPQVLFSDYFREWVVVFKKATIGKNTAARYGDTLASIVEHFPGVYIQDIDKRVYQTYLNKYGETHAISSSRKMNSHIRACVLDALDEGVIEIDFTRRTKVSGQPEKPENEKFINFADSKRLTKEIGDNPKTLSRYAIVMLLAIGARFAELVGLTRDDFDFENNMIDINKTWGYTNKMHTGFGATKNPQSVRKQKAPKVVMDMFKRLFETTPENPHGLVFYSASSKYHVISNQAVNKELEILLNRLEIDPVITAHGLRHTYASTLLYKRVSIFTIAERLGHKSTDQTTKTYAHILKELRVEDDIISQQHMEEMFAA